MRPLSLMKIDVAFTPGLHDRSSPAVAVVIDVLRATSSIAALVGRGVPAVHLAAGAAAAVALRTRLGGGTWLCGEAGGVPPGGFDYGNSPWQFANLPLPGPPPAVVLVSTNGTRALLLAAPAPVVYAGALLNGGAVIDAALRDAIARDLGVTFVCAGEAGGARFALEDAYAAGALVARLCVEAERAGVGVERTDAAEAAMLIGRGFGWKADRALRESEHGRALTALGFADDVAFCARNDSFDIAPRLRVDGESVCVVAGPRAAG